MVENIGFLCLPMVWARIKDLTEKEFDEFIKNPIELDGIVINYGDFQFGFKYDESTSEIKIEQVFSEKAQLITGQQFNELFAKDIKQQIKKIEYTVDDPNPNITDVYDITVAKDKSVMVWYDDTDQTQYWKCMKQPLLNPNSDGMFSSYNAVTEINILSSFDTSNTTNINNMFYYCNKLTSLDVSNFDTSNVTNMSNMFYECISLSNITYGSNFTNDGILSSLDETTKKCPATEMMFYNCIANKPNWKGEWDNEGTFVYIIRVTLVDGGTFNSTINRNAALFVRSDTPPDNTNDIVTDISEAQDGSIVTWYDSTNTTQYWYSDADIIYMNPSSYTMFKKCRELTSLDLSSFDTSKVTSMNYMFNECNKLTSLDLSSFDTSKVTSMYGMFSECPSLTTLDLSNWDTSNVTNMGIMFDECGVLDNLNLSHWNTSNVIDMGRMFYNCKLLTTLNISNWDISNVTTMSRMFYNCTSLTTLDLSNFNTSNVTSMYGMFRGCKLLTTLDISSFNTSKVTDMRETFYNCQLLTNISYGSNFTNDGILSSLNETTKIYEKTNAMFYNCLANKPTWTNGMWNTGGAFVYVQETTLVAGNVFNTSIEKAATSFTRSNTLPNGITTTDISEAQDKSIVTWYDESNTTQYWYSNADIIYMNPDSSNMFKKCRELTSLDLSSFDTSKAINMNDMFNGCGSLTSLDVSTFDTSNVTDMSNMFRNCYVLTSLNISSFNTSKVTTMDNMFYGCRGLTTLDLSHFDTSKVTTMDNMFNGCRGLTTLNVSSFDTSNMINMYGVFNYCSSLTSLDVSSFDTSKVKDMSNMFSDCAKLTSLDLHSFDSSKIMGMINMFYNCTSLATLNISSFNTSNVVNMYKTFYNCTSLANISYGSNFVNDGILYSLDTTTKKYTATEMMFCNCPANKPEWDGIWDIEGTFVYVKKTTLGAGNIFNAAINKDATSFVKANVQSNAIPDNAIDISNNGDKSILTWYDSTNTTQYWYSDADVIYMNEDSSYMFNDCSELVSVELSNWDTSKVTNMNYMFQNCGALTSLALLSNWDTSNVIAMNRMFSDCYGLTSLDLSNWNTSNVIDMGNMFKNCYALTSLNISNFNTSKVIDMNHMFESCEAITSLDLSHFDTSNVTDMSQMFFYCISLTSLNLSNWDTSKVVNMWCMFGNSGLKNLSLSSFNTSNVTDMSQMFASCSELITLNLSSFDTSKVTDMRYMFSDCTNLTTILYGNNFVNTGILPSLDTSTDYYNDTTRMFYNCPANKPNWLNGLWDVVYGTFMYATAATLVTGEEFNAIINRNATSFVRTTYAPTSDIVTTDISKDKDKPILTWYNESSTIQYWYGNYDIIYMNENLSDMFYDCSSLTSLDLSSFNTMKVTDMSRMFYGCDALTTLNISSFNTSNVTDMSQMFYRCRSLTSLNLFPFNTMKVTNMNKMFYRCDALTTLNISSFNTSNVTNMSYIIYGCSKLTSLDLSHFNTSKVTDMSYMFYDCNRLTSLDLSHFDTSKVTNMSSIFGGCYYLTSLNILSFDTANVTNMSYMFSSCSSLTSLDVSHFNTSKVTNMSSMFNRCSKLTSLDLSHFNTSNVTDMQLMFSGCELLTNISYGSNFINDGILSSLNHSSGIYNDTVHMFNNCPANKPNWTNGTWNTDGSFIKS